jgi:hypothetical protein
MKKAAYDKAAFFAFCAGSDARAITEIGNAARFDAQ